MAFCLITGASQGYGRELAIQFARKKNDEGVEDIDIVLIARSHSHLQQTEEALKSHSKVRTHIHAIDLSDLDPVEDKIKEILSKVFQYS